MLDAREYLAELMGNEDQGRIAQGDLFEILEQLALCSKIKTRCRFVEHEGLGAMGNGSCQKRSATFSSGHGSKCPVCQMLDPHEFKCCVGRLEHRLADCLLVGFEFTRKKSGEDGFDRRELAGAAGMKMLIDLSADESQLGTKLPDVPFALAKDADATGLSLNVGRIQVSHHEFKQGGFPRSIWPEDSGVLSLGNRKRNAIEQGIASSDDRDVLDVENLEVGLHRWRILI